jgi:hypothetical protein
MKKLLCGLVVLPFLSTVALAQPAGSAPQPAQPMQLSENQMDSVTAGFSLTEVDISNTTWTAVSVWEPGGNTISCSACYLSVTSPALSVASVFGISPK